MSILTASLSVPVFAHTDCDATKLHDYMEDMKTDLKSLSFEIRTGNTENALTRIDSIQNYLMLSRDEMPYLFNHKELLDDELTKRKADYQNAIDKTSDVFAELKVAITDGDQAKIKSLIKKVGKLRKVGHRTFQYEC
ncbi:cytochrome b562 [Marinomonas sp. 2405UD68-3]|uniref:cytochrome b562 n=1 Tax=Marinomonas sp. 2405UD68-3 TaxID=3391835 RepID=UPI0039C9FBC5